jgi:hypothetical protein
MTERQKAQLYWQDLSSKSYSNVLLAASASPHTRGNHFRDKTANFARTRTHEILRGLQVGVIRKVEALIERRG